LRKKIIDSSKISINIQEEEMQENYLARGMKQRREMTIGTRENLPGHEFSREVEKRDHSCFPCRNSL